MRIGRVENALDLGRDGPVHEGSSSLESTRESWMECRSAGCSIRQLELSSDHDPLYLFHQWQANLRVLEIQEIKTVPYVPLSHPFVERLIGTIRREYLDQTLFWTGVDLEQKLRLFRDYFNKHRVHSGLKGRLPDSDGAPTPLSFASYRWQQHCRGLYQTPIAA